MNIGVIGLGKMGHAVAYRLANAEHEVLGFDLDEDIRSRAAQEGISVTASLDTLAQQVDVFWLLVPAGKPVDSVIAEITPHLQKGHIIVDGGNSNYIDSMRRAQDLKKLGVDFLDCGTSGGVHGKKDGFCLMIGGSEYAYEKMKKAFEDVAMKNGTAHVGPSGAGHYVKMVHNGIEYGLMQAYAEGFHIIKEGAFKDAQLDLEKISELWNHGAVIRSWLLELTHNIFVQDQNLENVSGEVSESGMGKWTIQEADDKNISARVIEESLKVRAWSRDTGGNYATKLVALMRNQFGGHAFKTKEKKNEDI